MTLVSSSRNAGPVFSSSPAQPRQDSAPKQEAQPSSTPQALPSQVDTFEPQKKEPKKERVTGKTVFITISQQGGPPAVVPDGSRDMKNRAGPRQFAKGGWEQTTPIVKQTQSDTCGAAVAAMLGGSKNHKKVQKPEQYMVRLANRTSDGNPGTTPQEMAKMLAFEGMEVVQSAKGFDPALARPTLLKHGGKLVAQVDSQVLALNGSEGVRGAAHWVVIDGVDTEGNYLVKDPATGRNEFLPLSRLVAAVEACWAKHGGGGMMTLKNSPQATKAWLEENNLKHAEALGKCPGGGSAGSEKSPNEANNQA